MSSHFSRRRFLQSLSAAGALPAVAAGRRPNVLFISIDDLNDWVGSLAGHPQTVTPNIGWLAKRGVLFEKASMRAAGEA